MSDARLRSEWLGQMRFDDLSDTAWRIFTSALMWSVGNGTDGVIPKRYLRYLHPEGVKPEANVEIVQAGLWTEQGDAFVLIDWAGALGQSTAEQIEKYRDDARERQRRRRERARERRETQEAGRQESTPHSGAVTPEVTRDILRDVTPNVGIGIGNGKGTGNGHDEGTEQSVDERTGEVTSWPTAVPGRPGVTATVEGEIEVEPGVWVPVSQRGAA